jgi:AcrR family transcriptional regulator
MARDYRMQKRAEARDQVRERIVEATMRLHDEKGVVPTTFAEIAERAGVGPATVSRHFPTLGDLVRACGVHVWHEMRPPTPDTVASVFAEAKTGRDRLVRLVEELDAFYARGPNRRSPSWHRTSTCSCECQIFNAFNPCTVRISPFHFSEGKGRDCRRGFGVGSREDSAMTPS